MTDLYSEARLILAAALIISPLRSTRARGERDTFNQTTLLLLLSLFSIARPCPVVGAEGARGRVDTSARPILLKNYAPIWRLAHTRFLFAPQSVSSGCFIVPTHWPAALEEGGNLPQMHANRTEIRWTWLILRVLNCCPSRRPIQVQSLHAPRTLRSENLKQFLSSSRHGT